MNTVTIRINNCSSAPGEINAASSKIANNLVDSYYSAIYRINIIGSESICLQINQFSRSLSNFLNELEYPCATIISAYNPYSQQLSDGENETAHQSLRELLLNRSCRILEGVNLDPSGYWPVEKSFCVAGLDLDTAKFIGQQYCQNAIVWIDKDAAPRLILLR